MAFDIAAWRNYGVAVVSATAALTGLVFTVRLVTGILLLIPGQSPTALGIEIVVFNLVVGRLFLALGSGEVTDEPRSMVAIDRLSPRVITAVALIAAGVSLIVKHFGGLYWLPASTSSPYSPVFSTPGYSFSPQVPIRRAKPGA